MKQFSNSNLYTNISFILESMCFTFCFETFFCCCSNKKNKLDIVYSKFYEHLKHENC